MNPLPTITCPKISTTVTDTLGKVPEVTLLFWIIKIAAATLGETGATPCRCR